MESTVPSRLQSPACGACEVQLLITVVPEDKVDALLAGLRPLLDASSGVMFLTETYVSRPDYFS